VPELPPLLQETLPFGKEPSRLLTKPVTVTEVAVVENPFMGDSMDMGVPELVTVMSELPPPPPQPATLKSNIVETRMSETTPRIVCLFVPANSS
jgi:hypothetical protein